MARFRYTLQSILDIKLKLETQAKQRFAAALGALSEEENRLAALRERRDLYEERARQLLSGNLDVLEIEENKTAILVIDNYIAEQIKRVELARKRMEQARQAMAEAMMERKTYETLREQAFENFLQEENREEGKAVDELVSYTYGQKRQVKE
ncbi:MAG: flagellar export protein FliJ [Roseburia sp.]|nr:flagellar export protein FliJ [Roseburia sp.]